MYFSFEDEIKKSFNDVKDEDIAKAVEMAIDDLIVNKKYTRAQIDEALNNKNIKNDENQVKNDIVATVIIALKIILRMKKQG